MELRIREFQKQDMDALYFLDMGCYPEEQRSTYRALLNTLLDKDCAALVAEELGEGYARVIAALIVRGEPSQSRLHIVSLTVNDEFRRLGIARRLLGWADRLAREADCHTLLLRLPEDNAPGEAFMTANGFAVCHEIEKPEAGTGMLWIREVRDEDPT